MESAPVQTMVAAWGYVAARVAPVSIHSETELLLSAAAFQLRRWRMVEPTMAAAKALLMLWDQQDAAIHPLPSALQYRTCRPGQYAGGHEILLEVLMWADKLKTGATLPDGQIQTLRHLLTQALHIGSGSSEAMRGLRAQVGDSIDILSALGHSEALDSALGGLQNLLTQLREVACTLASVALTSTARHSMCHEVLKGLRAAIQQIGHTLRTSSRSSVPPRWVDIHDQLRDRLMELGIACTPQQLGELHLAGNPSHFVQVLFATGSLDLDKFAR